MTELTAVSLFSGCGGLDLGMQQAGFRILLASDIEPLCAQSHQANFPGAAFYEGSVTDLTADVAADRTDGRTREGVDLLVGGPPCPPFSKSRFYRTDKPRAMDDPVGEATMNGYLDILKWLRPRAFLMENVAGLAYSVHGGALAHILGTATDLGYDIQHRVLNAADFGVPQMRQRFFIIGTEPGVSFRWPEPTHAETPAIHDLFSASRAPWVTAGEAIGDLDTDENADDAGHVAGGKHRHLLEQIPPGDNYLFLTAKRGHPNPEFEWRKRYWSFLLKLSPDLPSWTIQARRSNNMGPLHWRNRILRIEEVKRLQAFPDDWYLSGNVEKQWRQVGNAVPPLLARRLGEALADSLSSVSSPSIRLAG
jgi:DNA (cytosine-5)-methyltransferase 1